MGATTLASSAINIITTLGGVGDLLTRSRKKSIQDSKNHRTRHILNCKSREYEDGREENGRDDNIEST
jgi:hypothetical protein